MIPWVKSGRGSPPTPAKTTHWGHNGQTLCGAWLLTRGHEASPALVAANTWCRKCVDRKRKLYKE